MLSSSPDFDHLHSEWTGLDAERILQKELGDLNEVPVYG